MWDFSLFGRRLFSVTDENYQRIANITTAVSVVLVAALAVGICAGIGLLAHNALASPTKATAATAPATPATDAELTNPRANDVEPERMVIRSLNWAVANGSVKIRSRFGTATANFAWFCHSDGCEWRANVKDAFDLRLADGPYLVTAYNSANNPVATFRLDRTGSDSVEVITIYLLNNSREFTPMLSIEGVGNHFEPLGRETYTDRIPMMG